MRTKRTIFAFFTAGVLLTAATSAWFAAGRVPKLTSPLRIVDAYALSDGGTMWVAVVDAKGTWFGFGISGSLDTPRENFPVVVRPWEALPLFRQYSPGDERILEVARVAKQAAEDSAGKPNSAVFAEELANKLASRSRKGS